MKVGDYIIFSYLSESNKKGRLNCLAKVKSLNPLTVLIEPDITLKQEQCTIKKSDVICSLGPQPRTGKAYSVDLTNIYRTKQEISNFGYLHYFCKPEKEVRTALRHSFSIVYKKLMGKGLSFVVQDDIRYRVRVLTGKTSGMYHHFADYCLIDIDPAKTTISDIPYVIAHELGHHVLHYLNEEWRLKWVKLYIKYIRPKSFSREQCNELKSLVEEGEDLSEIRSSLEDSELFDKCLSQVKKNCKINTKTLKSLFEQDKQSILNFWPTQITISDYESIISQYATKSYEETFAEAFAFYLLDKDLNPKIGKLMAKTLSAAKILARGE